MSLLSHRFTLFVAAGALATGIVLSAQTPPPPQTPQAPAPFRLATDLVRAIFRLRSERLAGPLAALDQLVPSGQTTSSRDSMRRSLIHMHMNRVFRVITGLQQQVRLDLLHQYYPC